MSFMSIELLSLHSSMLNLSLSEVTESIFGVAPVFMKPLFVGKISGVCSSCIAASLSFKLQEMLNGFRINDGIFGLLSSS